MSCDLKFERAVAFARDLIRIPSISGEEGAVAARVVEELKLLKFDDVWIDEIGNVLARVKGRGGAPSIMLNSHLDVVEAGDAGQWEHPPFGGEIANGYLHGRGATDCKGPLALQAYAAASLIDARPAGEVYLAFTVFEERGSWGMDHLMKQRDVRPAAMILGEATEGDICIGHRGRKELLITIRGRAAHASAPERGSNPVDFIPAVLDAMRNFVERLPSHEVLPDSTLVPTMIETWPRSSNMVPEEVRIVIDWRTLPASDDENSAERLQTFLRNRLGAKTCDGLSVQEVSETRSAYTGMERTATISTAGFLLPDSHPLVQTAVRSVRAATGHAAVARPWRFGTDGGCSCGIYDIPTIGYAPGREAVAHTNRERLSLDAAREAYDAYPALIAEMQRALATDILHEPFVA